ncbi:hypothetical protein B9Z55_008506 [Caenorhabditis nigoni]|uniref:BHLH domain-containing protein n=1 Tax=Caenorhabditis nigoni TaxID=1611254 RepID=A0A2G5UNJ7_9PELO|nr:hypothetical protein B9Z55_008506 [Caenorhabditis nigoni]
MEVREKEQRPPKKNNSLRVKKETAIKKETRSRHEKKRREEFNEVLNEMMELLPDDSIAGLVHKTNQKPKQPDKCFIIGNAAAMIKKSDYRPGLLIDIFTRDVFHLANAFMIFMENLVIIEIEGDHRSIFDLEKKKMLGKDIRCFLDFESASKLSFLDPNNLLLAQIQLSSFLAKSMSCKLKNSSENPSESVLVCVPHELNQIEPRPLSEAPPPTTTQMTPPKSPPPSKLEVERPILAALLRKKDTPKVLEAPSTSSSTFLSPTSSTTSTVPQTVKNTVCRKIEPKKRKRIRSMNVIVESFPLDVEEKPPKKMRKRRSEPAPTIPVAPIPVHTPQPVIHPIPIQNYGMSPLDILSPGYRDIWLRLQSERVLLEERISAKKGELTNLMSQSPNFNLLNIPQYFVPPSSNI